MAMALRNIVGAPLGRAEREAYGAGLVQFFGSTRAVNDYFVKSIDRITNKSVGLMQADSIFAALALFLSDRPRWGVLGSIALVLLLVAVGLLCSNLVATSSGLSASKLNDEAIMRHGLKLNCERTIRFTLALYLTFAAFSLIILQVLIGML